MTSGGLSYEDKLENQWLAYELLKRRLRTSYVSHVVKGFSLTELRDMYREIHQGEKPRSGLLPAIEAIPHIRESMLYLSLFASIYRCTSQVDIQTETDVQAVIFAWDFLCESFPGHIRERRPYGKIRPANFSEAWVIAQSLRSGLATLHYCESCHGDYLIISGSKFPPTCQICALDEIRKRERKPPNAIDSQVAAGAIANFHES